MVDTRLDRYPDLAHIAADVRKGGMATSAVVLSFDVIEEGLAKGVGLHQWSTMNAVDLKAIEKGSTIALS